MIVTQLLGGMGNQMFQYAIGKQLSILNNTELKLDTSILLNWKPGKHAVNRGFDLDIFNIIPHFATRRETIYYHADGASIPLKLYHKLLGNYNARVVEKFFHFDKNILNVSDNSYLAGTWQSYKYFESIEATIRKDFTIVKSLSPEAKVLMQEIQNEVAVCLNVRKTDYVSVQQTAQTMANIPVDYYETALLQMQQQIGVPFKVYIFADDMQWCKQNLDFLPYNKIFIDHQYAGEKFNNYLQLMIACKHFIIPNSTFAWWAAWLSNNENKTIITPKKWFNDSTVVTNDLIPNNWLRL